MSQAILYEKLVQGKVRCTACRHYCEIPEGLSGICGVRQNQAGELRLLVYGQPVAVNLDPIEKKPLFHFLPGTEIFSLGTMGCNFACEFCQNWDISQAAKEFKKKLAREKRSRDFASEIKKYGYDLPPEKIVAECVKNNIPSIAFTYNEPTIFFEYAYDTAKRARGHGIKNVFVSNGYASSEAVDLIAPYLDAINIDLKSFREDFYQQVCHARLQPVLESIKYYYQKGIWLEITTLVIPDQNDSDEELAKIAEFIASVSPSIPWHVTRFHPDYKMADNISTPERVLKAAHDIGKQAGIKYVYVGNVINEDLQSTYCPKCKNKLIDRNWNLVKVVDLEGGQCGKCGVKIEGVWE